MPDGITPVGGIVLDLIGTSGVRVISQIAASDLYVGYFGANPGLIGIQSGFTAAAINALGGGIAEASVRFTIDDGDTAPGNFDDNDNTLLINNIAFGNFSDVRTVVTDGAGNVLGAEGTGFPNGQLATGFFHLTEPSALSALFESLFEGAVTFALSDTDPGDNFFDFTQGIDGELVDVGQGPNVSPVIERILLPETIEEGSRYAVRVDATDPDETTGGLTYRFDIDGDGVFDAENTTGIARFTAFDDLDGSVLVEVADARGGLTRQSIALPIENVAPSVVLDPVTTVASGGTAVLSGTITDPGLLDSFTVEVDWGDGTTTPYEIPASAVGAQEFSFTHRYAGGKESKSYPVSVTVRDDDGGTAEATTSVLVQVETPTIVLAPLETTREGEAALLSGTVTGLNGVERFVVEVDWGDGTVERIPVFARDKGVFSATHVFAADDPTQTALDRYPVTAQIISPGVRVSDGETAAVRNVAPVLRLDDLAPVVVGGVLTLSGELVDPGLGDSFTIGVSWGDETSSSLALDASAAGRQRFELEHRFETTTPTGNVPILITVRDDDGAVRSYTRTASVEADPPQIALSKPSAVQENGVVTLSGTITTVTDPGPFAVTVVWGDGVSETLLFDPAEQETDTFSLSHRYLDDKASGADRYAITVSAEGSHGAGSTATTSVAVANIAPTLRLAPVEDIGPDGIATLTGTVIDPGRNDTFTVRIDWGEVGSATRFETVTLGPSATGRQTFERRHAYDDATGADRYNVVATVVDDDGGQMRATRTVETSNTAPTLTLDAVGARYEGGVAILRGTIADPDNTGPIVLAVNWGDGEANSVQTVNIDVGPEGPRQFTLTHRYLDDPLRQPGDLFAITASVRDREGDTDAETTNVRIVNTAPTLIAPLGSNIAPGDTVAAAALVAINGQFRDFGVRDAHTVEIDWGDGQTVWSDTMPGRSTQVVDNGGSGQFAAGHRYAAGGFYTVTVAVHDDDGGQSLNRKRIAVEGVGLGTDGALDVIAGDEAAVINIFGDSAVRGRLIGERPSLQDTAASPFLTVTTDIPRAFSQSVASSAVETVNFFGSALADTVNLAPSAKVAATIHGNGGGDRLFGSVRGDHIMGDGGGDLILGREGLDTITGGTGNDSLYGDFDAIKFGAYADLVRGGDGNDTVLGGGGNDTLTGDAGNDFLAGGAESDLVMGGAGADVIFGDGDTLAPASVQPVSPIASTGSGPSSSNGSGADPLPRAATSVVDGSDWLVGGDGNDSLYGQNGFDSLNGGNGNDVLDGGNGNDVLRLGAGADRIVFRAGDDADTVFDFGPGDRIDLRDLGRSYIDNVRDVLARTFADGEDTVIDLGFGDSLRLLDTARGEINADDFLV
ncbi:PKD domain-containing protein [Acuticoccus sp. MNP-M23]|uniref:PKD domain-containing protein n=1 Tax=Acuticoccus sp. MNP-M23 TaxID=3072793 RepID=UPI00281628D2|nr:PKD domain-containing protein [Acuticoccus sp. MNP-M23]WMS42220.1 PKD domain-containing protein [Acuticoccus sp. MNP-M23]